MRSQKKNEIRREGLCGGEGAWGEAGVSGEMSSRSNVTPTLVKRKAMMHLLDLPF